MVKIITTKIDDVTYQKLIEKCESSNENKCQYLKRVVESDLLDKNNSNIKDDKKPKSDKQLTLTLQFDGTWRTPEGKIVEESDERFEKSIRLKIV